jgi:L-seryl-tRNA(Ser) seleniumtransferase
MRTLAILSLSAFATLVAAEPANVAGKWNVTLQLESITGHPVILLKQDGEKLTGIYEGRYGQSELKGSIKEKEIEFTVSIVAEGMQTQGVFAGKVDGDTMSGNVSYEGAGDGTWSAARAKQ